MGFLEAVTNRGQRLGIGFDIRLYRAEPESLPYWRIGTAAWLAPKFQPLIAQCSDITTELSFGEAMAGPSEVTLSVIRKQVALPNQEVYPDIVEAVLNGYEIVGRPIRAWLCAVEEDGTLNEYRIWSGYVTTFAYDQTVVRIGAISKIDHLLSRKINLDTINKADYGDAPVESIGQAIPRVFGEWKTDIGAPPDYPDAYKKRAEQAGLCPFENVVPAFCIAERLSRDIAPQFVVSSHELKTFPFSNRHSVYVMKGPAVLVADSDEVTIENGSNGATVEFTASPSLYYSMPVRDYYYGGTFAFDNPERAFDRELETAATLRQGSTVTYGLGGRLVKLPDWGIIESVSVLAVISYNVRDGEEIVVRYGLHDVDQPMGSRWVGGYGEDTLQGYFIYTQHEHLVDPLPGSYASDFPKNLAVFLETDRGLLGADEWLKVHALAVIVNYEGRLLVQVREKTTRGYHMVRRPKFLRQAQTPEFVMREKVLWTENYPLAEPTSVNVYCACEGLEDVTGALEGTVGALVQTPVAIMYALLSDVDVAVASEEPGSYAQTLAAQQSDGLRARLVIEEPRTYGEVLKALAAASLVGVSSNTAGEFALVYWPGVENRSLYDEPIQAEYVLQVLIGYTPFGRVKNGIYVACEYSPRLGKNTRLAYCDKNGSDDGYGNDDYADKAALSASEDKYGRHELHLDAYPLRASSAAFVRDQYARMLREQRVALRMRLTWRYYDLMPGHVIEIDDESWRDAGLYYPGETNGQSGYWAYGGVSRKFIVERVTFFPIGQMEVEASELPS